MKKPHDILGLVKLLKKLSLDHYAIADFRHDIELNFDDESNYNYPLVFLEAEKQIVGNRDDNSSTYTVAIQLCDKAYDVTQCEAKLEYITRDLVHALTKLQVRVTDTNSLSYHEQHDDVLLVRRTEFTLTLGNNTTGYGNPFRPEPTPIITPEPIQLIDVDINFGGIDIIDMA